MKRSTLLGGALLLAGVALLACLDPLGFRAAPPSPTPLRGPGPAEEDEPAANPEAARRPEGEPGTSPAGGHGPAAGTGTPSPRREPDPSEIAGTVVDASGGEALAGVAVRVRAPAPAEGAEGAAAPAEPPPPPVDARTDANGEFLVPWAKGALADVTVGGGAYAAERRRDVRAGQRATFRLSAGVEVVGIVVSADGAPLADAWVRVLPARPLPPTSGALLPDGVRTGPDGRFAIPGVPRVDLRVRAHHARHAPKEVALAAGDGAPVRLALAPVLLAWFRLRGQDGSAVRGARLAWDDPGPPPARGIAALGDGPPADEGERAVAEAADAPGTIGPVKLPAGGAPSLVVSAPGFLAWEKEGEPVPAAGGIRLYEVVLAPDPAVGRLRVRLRDAVPAESPAGTASPAGAAPPAAPERPVVRLTRTDGVAAGGGGPVEDDGDLLYVGLPAGAYRVTVARRGRAPAVVEADVAAGAEAVAAGAFGAEARLVVRIDAPGKRRVRFRLTKDGEPAVAFAVAGPRAREGVGDPASPTFLADREGTALGGLGTGTYVVEVASPDLVAAPARVDLVAGESRDAHLDARAR